MYGDARHIELSLYQGILIRAGVLTPAERYELIQTAGPGIRKAVAEIRAIKEAFPEATTEQLQERLNAKVAAQKRLAMRGVLGLR